MDDLPISYINQYAYCPRRFWYMYVYGEMVANVHVLRGQLNHERVHQAGREGLGEAGVALHRLYVYSRRLGLTGYCDRVEIGPDGTPYPVEYKQGRQGKWANDQAQLCAQALCLEEMTGRSVPKGAIFYFGSRRREEVYFTPELREETERLVRAMHAALAAGVLPPPTEHKARCRGCSLYDICLPRESEILQS